MNATLHGCPQADATKTTVYARALHRACVLLGGIHQLALHLDVSDEQVEEWLDGNDDPPMDVFLVAVDVVLADSNRTKR
jgi:hypothetical protein